MPSNWSKIRDEWLDRTAIAKDDAKWALEALINSEEELFEIEQKIKNKELFRTIPNRTGIIKYFTTFWKFL